MNRYLAAYFSPLRDPYYKDWIFYLFLIFTLPGVIEAINSNVGLAAIFPIVFLLIINWIVFIYGISWIRSFGTNKFSIGLVERYKPAKKANYPVLDKKGNNIMEGSLQSVGKKLALSSSESMNLYDTSSPDFHASLEANFLWTILDINSNITSRFYGPVWFQSSELKNPVPALLTVTFSGEIGISWRKHKNSLLDYTISHLAEVRSYNQVSDSRLEIELGTVNRCIGQISGLRNSETYIIELRLGRDGHENRRSLTAFYTLLKTLRND